MGAPISVVIPCYNQGRFLGEAVDSALRQTYPPFEVIVVDDGSTDDTAEIAARYPVRYLRQSNRGPSAARNTGVRGSGGEYVAFLDADDRLLPAALEVGASALDAAPGAVFAVGLYRRIDAQGHPLPAGHRPKLGLDPYVSLLCRCSIAVPAVMYRRALLLEAGGFDERLRYAEDYDLYLRLVRRYPIVDHYTEVTEYRQHAAMMTRNAAAMLAATVSVLEKHRPAPDATPAHRAAYEARENVAWFHQQLLDAVLDDFRHGRVWGGVRALGPLAWYLPRHRGWVRSLGRRGVRFSARLLRRSWHRAVGASSSGSS